MFWTHPIIFLGRPKLLFSRALALIFTAVQIDYVGAAVRAGTAEQRCGRALTERGGDRPTRAQELNRSSQRERRSDRNAVVITKPAAPAAIIGLPRDR